jgi:hypothetical protein
MSGTVLTMALKPMNVLGHAVTSADLVAVVDGLANAPDRFIAMDILGPLPQHGGHWKQEVANRLLQRWRKLALVSFKAGRWSLSRGAWDVLQSAFPLTQLEQAA